MVGELTIPGGIAASTVADAAAGDADALARIVGAHHDDMARVCYVICGDQDMAQDAVQAVWPIAWRKLGSLRDPERLRPWLWRSRPTRSVSPCAGTVATGSSRSRSPISAHTRATQPRDRR